MDSGQQKEREPRITGDRTEHPTETTDRLLQDFLDWLKREKIPIHGWITALSSVALLAVTFGQLVVAWQNYNVTSPLVDYARRNTEAAEKFATSADKINEGIGQAVGSLSAQAGYAKQNLTDTKSAVHLEESPWVNILGIIPKMNPNGSESFTVAFTNSGKSPAFDAHVDSQMVVLPGTPPTFVFAEKNAKGTATLTPGEAPYEVDIDVPIQPGVVRAYRAGLTHPYIGVAIWYTDYWRQKQEVNFCLTWGLESKAWVHRKPDHCEE